MTTEKKALPIAPRIIALNDTQYYNLCDCGKKYIESIFTVYLYDRNSHVHYCEFTPSYNLIYLYTQVRFKDVDPGDDIREYLHDKYSCNDGEDTMIHCHDVNKMENTKIDSGDFYIAEDVIIGDDETYDEAMEQLRETYTCNCVV